MRETNLNIAPAHGQKNIFMISNHNIFSFVKSNLNNLFSSDNI